MRRVTRLISSRSLQQMGRLFYSTSRKTASDYQRRKNPRSALRLPPSSKRLLEHLILNTHEKRKDPLRLPVREIPSHTLMKLYQLRAPTVDFNSIGGNTEVLQQFADLVTFLQNPTQENKHRAKMPRGVLLTGAPGVGKTMMAEALAGHAGVTFISISAAHLNHIYVGGSEENIRKLFAEARANTPCVLFIDEIDAIGTKRFKDPQQGSERTANSVVDCLLAELTEPNTGVLVIAATNDASKLDEALIRQGRFDRHIKILLPDKAARLEILKIHVKEKKLEHANMLPILAELTLGYHGAQIATLVNEAAILATRTDAETITLAHFEEARQAIDHGTPRAINPIDLPHTALHEAGHAVVAHALGFKIRFVSIIPRGNAQGMTEWLPNEAHGDVTTMQEMLDKICMILGGRAAEKVADKILIGSKNDIDKAYLCAQQLIEDGIGTTLTATNGSMVALDIERIMQEQLLRAQNIIKENLTKWRSVTDTLVKEHEISGDQFLMLMTGSRPVFFQNRLKQSLLTSQPLPPSKLGTNPTPDALKKMPAEKANSKEVKLPFTIEQVAKAINVSPASIRSIEHFQSSLFNIYFKISFQGHHEMEKTVQNLLHPNDIECHYARPRDHHAGRLCIHEQGAQDFITFVRKRNEEPGTPPAPTFKK